VGDLCYISLHVLMSNFCTLYVGLLHCFLVLDSWHHRQRQLVWQNFTHKEHACTHRRMWDFLNPLTRVFKALSLSSAHDTEEQSNKLIQSWFDDFREGFLWTTHNEQSRSQHSFIHSFPCFISWTQNTEVKVLEISAPGLRSAPQIQGLGFRVWV